MPTPDGTLTKEEIRWIAEWLAIQFRKNDISQELVAERIEVMLRHTLETFKNALWLSMGFSKESIEFLEMKRAQKSHKTWMKNELKKEEAETNDKNASEHSSTDK